MADDQNKPSTIDDLVKELSKNGSPNQSRFSPAGQENRGSSMAAPSGPPPNLPGVKVGDKPAIPPMPPRPQVPPPPVGVPKPPVPSPAPIQPKPQPTPSPAPSGPIGMARPSPVQEYKSSIRTMGEDITSIKAGQKPLGVEVPRKVTPEMPKAPIPEAPKQTSPTAPTGPRPVVGLGRAEKAEGLPTPTAPQKPVAPSRPPTLQPSAPIAQPPISVPGARKGLGLSTNLYLAIAGVLVIGGFLYWFLILRTVEPEVVLSPTPTPTQTVIPTPVIKNLSDIFEGTPVNFEVVSGDNLGQDFKTFVNTLSVASKGFTKINLVESVNNALVTITFLDIFDEDLILYPASFRDNILDSATLAYGQSEAFNTDGSINFNTQNLKKTVFVARIRDKAAVETMMKDWEPTLAKDLANYVLIADTSKEASINFLDNTYRGATIRYKNFPFPDTTLDYSIVETAGQNYLVIAGSREAVYAAVDMLLSQ